MKRNLTKLMTLGGIALLMLSACKKDGAVVTSNGGKPGTLSASSTTLVLDKSKQNDASAAITFNFTNANYGFDAAVTNTLQIDSAGDNWNKPTSVTLGTKAGAVSYSTADFNAMLLKLNLKGGVTSQIKVRLQHTVSAQVAPVYSNELSLTVTPYSLVAFIYVPGAYQGWNPATADSLMSATSNGIYSGVIPFTPGNDQFLITPVKNWNNKWATPDGQQSGATVTYNTQYVTGGGNNFYAISKSTVDPSVNITYNQAVLDANKNTLTLTPVLWSVVGDATPGGWPNGSGYQSDTDMKFNNGTQTWSVKVALKAGGAIKFRMNHDWGKNYGSVKVAGILDTADNNNINITEAGTYLITIDLNALTYKLVKQ
ncbi:MAG TPA: SusE domain-containing protein [Mucilaginibacter sp.]